MVVDVQLHVGSGITFAALEEIVGIVRVAPVAGTNGHAEDAGGFKGLAFTDTDEAGNTRIHVYALDDEGRRNLIGQLSGGVVIPT